MPQKEIIKLAWPMAGLVENSPFTQQPENSTLDALNVRPYDQFDRKARGGQRPGLSKYMTGQVNGAADIQSLLSVVEAVELTEDAGFGDKYANPSNLPPANGASIDFHPNGNWLLVGSSGSGTTMIAYELNLITGFTGTKHTLTTGTTTVKASFNAAGNFICVTRSDLGGKTIYVYPFEESTGFGTPFTKTISHVVYGTHPPRWSPDGSTVFVITGEDPSTSFQTVRAFSFDASSGIGAEIDSINVGLTTWDLAVHPDGDWIAVVQSVGDVLQAFSFAPDMGFGPAVLPGTAPLDQCKGCAFNSDGTQLAVAVVDGSADLEVYPFDKISGFGTPDIKDEGGGSISSYAVAWDSSDNYIAVACQATPYIQCYPFSGVIGTSLTDPSTLPTGVGNDIAWHPNSSVLAVAHNTTPFFSTYEFTAETVNPSARKNRVIAVAGGDIYRSNYPPTVMGLANSGAGVLRTANPIEGAEAFQNVFFCDGLFANYVYLDLSDNTVKDWQTAVAAAIAGTELPRGTDDDTLGCRIMALYRGRIVMSGLKEEPHNWFMSASGNPFDWDYSPSPATATQAVAGNNSEVGELGDIITALIPFQDDLLFMGGPNSLWVMRGDPAAGGQIDNVSRQIGIVQPRAYTWDPFGTLYFMGLNGFYRFMPDSSAPELLSTNRLDKTLQDINYEENQVMLTYDPTWRGVHVFISPLSQPSTASYHYFWDERTNSFWKDQYPTTHGPTSMVQYNADDPDNRALILGGYDGYLRYFDPAAKSDDGTAISSRVRFSQINPGGILASSRIGDINLMTDDQSGTVNFELYAAHSPEAAHELADSGSGARLTKALVGGRNITMRQKIAQNTFIPVLSQNELNESWAYETGGATIELLTRMHYKKV